MKCRYCDYEAQSHYFAAGGKIYGSRLLIEAHESGHEKERENMKKHEFAFIKDYLLSLTQDGNKVQHAAARQPLPTVRLETAVKRSDGSERRAIIGNLKLPKSHEQETVRSKPAELSPETSTRRAARDKRKKVIQNG